LNFFGSSISAVLRKLSAISSISRPQYAHPRHKNNLSKAPTVPLFRNDGENSGFNRLRAPIISKNPAHLDGGGKRGVWDPRQGDQPAPLHRPPPWKQPRGKWMVSLVNSHTNATSKRWHLWEIDFRFALNSTPGWLHRPFRAETTRTPSPVSFPSICTLLQPF